MRKRRLENTADVNVNISAELMNKVYNTRLVSSYPIDLRKIYRCGKSPPKLPTFLLPSSNYEDTMLCI